MLRISLAAVFAELIPLAVLVATVTIYGYVVPGQEKTAYEQFAAKAGSYIGPIVGTLATFGMAYWAARKPENTQLLHGLLTGALVVLLDLAIFATPKADFNLTDALVLVVSEENKRISLVEGGHMSQDLDHKSLREMLYTAFNMQMEFAMERTE